MTEYTKPESETRLHWWGQYYLDTDQAAHWQINAFRLAVQRLDNEWQLAYDYDPAVEWNDDTWFYAPGLPELDDVETATEESLDAAPESSDPPAENIEAVSEDDSESAEQTLPYKNQERYVFQKTEASLNLKPILADRSLIIRPVIPLYIPPGESACLYSSLPLWIQLEAGEKNEALQTLPLRRPSDTWFGPSTMEGELCYASRTSARLHLEKVPTRPHRALTQIVIHNQASQALQVDRLNLPVIYLSLYSTDEGVLWTQVVTMQRNRNTGMAALEITNQLPDNVNAAELLNGPRQEVNTSLVVRAFETLLRK